MNKNKAVVLAKVQTGLGVDATPVGTDAILCEDPSIEPVTKELERNNISSYFGTDAPVNIGEALKLSFTTELKGAGAAGTAPEIGVLFRGANYTETISAGVSVAYDPNSLTSTAELLTLYYYLDGILFKLIDARGDWELSAKSGEYAKIKWTFTGIYAGPVDAAIVSPTFDTTVPPRFVSALLSIHSVSPVFESLTIKGGNEIGKRVNANASTGVLEYFIKNRKVTGELDPEAVTAATKDWWAAWAASTAAAFTTTIGSSAGNRCVITGPKVSIGALGYGDRDGVATMKMPLKFNRNAGNDEIKFLFN